MPAIDSVSALLAAWFFGVLIGYAVARIDGIARYLYNTATPQLGTQQPSFFAKNKAAAPVAVMKPAKIDIDTSKVVTEINTKGLERASAVELGTTKTKEDTINQSVSKLSQLKGK